MKRLRLPLGFLPIIGLLCSCASNDQPTFGVDEPDPGFFSREASDERSRKWGEKRQRWAEREEEKFNQMFDRMSGRYY